MAPAADPLELSHTVSKAAVGFLRSPTQPSRNPADSNNHNPANRRFCREAAVGNSMGATWSVDGYVPHTHRSLAQIDPPPTCFIVVSRFRDRLFQVSWHVRKRGSRLDRAMGEPQLTPHPHHIHPPPHHTEPIPSLLTYHVSAAY